MYESIGIDTVRFYKNFSPDEVERFIRPNMIWCDDGLCRFNRFIIFAHPYDRSRFSLEASVARMSGDDDSNLILANPERVRKVIDDFKRDTGLDVSDSSISRLDVAMNVETDHPVKDYFALVKKRDAYEVKDFEHGRYLNDGAKEKSLAMYDKMEEMRVKGKMGYHDGKASRIARIEFRMMRHPKRTLGITHELPALTLKTLAEPYGFVAAIQAYERNVKRLLNLKRCKRKEKGVKDIYETAQRRLMRMNQEQLGECLEEELKRTGSSDGVMEEAMRMYWMEREQFMKEELYEKITGMCEMMYERYPVEGLATISRTKIVQALMRRDRRRMEMMNEEKRADIPEIIKGWEC